MTAKHGDVPARRGVVDRVLASWAGPRAEMRRLLNDRPTEATLLSFLMIAALFGFMGRFIDHASQRWDIGEPGFVAAWEERYRAEAAEDPTLTPRDPAELAPAARRRALAEAMSDKLTRDRLEMLIGGFLIFPLGVYLFAGLATPILRAAGGTGGGLETRAAFAWAALVAAPAGLLAQIAVIFGAPPAPVPSLLGVAILALLLFFIASFLAEAHGFRSSASILGGLLAFLAVASLILFGLGVVLA